MKKNKFTEFLKGKGYYVLLFVGVIAIAAVALIGSQLSSNEKDKSQDFVDLNDDDEDNNITAGDNTDNQLAENNDDSDQIVNNGQGDDATDDVATNDDGQDVATNDDNIEYEDYSTGEVEDTDVADAADTADDAEEEEDDAVETSGNTVQSDNVPLMESLSFNTEDGLLWPVNGNVIMNYSMDHTIYHATLKLFKCNPAVIIDAAVGTEVKAAARGIVTSVDDKDETGLTVTTSIGDGYSVVYGQLSDVTLEVGDKVDEGDVIGAIAEPSRFYSVEGSNLYFKVLENENTVNPMSLLR
ncbi:MAG: hypothetical protein K0S76_1078 [Herbinix sp.]|nr:hypothetical protein [Herbinix sp.]